MARKEVLKKAREFLRTGDIQLLAIMPTQIQTIVGEKMEEGPDKKGYLVTRIKLKGRSIDTCQCRHHATHPDGRCCHKDAMVTYLVMKGI